MFCSFFFVVVVVWFCDDYLKECVGSGISNDEDSYLTWAIRTYTVTINAIHLNDYNAVWRLKN